MKTPVEIMVTNKKFNYRDMYVAGDIPEPHESSESYNGFMEIKKGTVTLDYEEALDGGITASTSVMLQNGVALISHRAEICTNLVFHPEKSCDCVCNNGYRNLNLRVNTTKLKSDIGPLGGKLNIDYTIEIMGNLAEKNSICVSVCPADSAS